MTRLVRTVLLSAALTLACGPIWGFQEKPGHGEKCPTSCEPCTQAVTKALDFLASRQVEDGCIPAQDMGLHYVRTDRTVTHVMTSALAGLAFLANGSTTKSGTYRNNLALLRRYLKEKIDVVINSSPRLAGGGGGPIYSATLCLQFFIHVFEKDKDEKAKATAQMLVRYLSDCVGTEVGTSVWKKGRDGGTVWYVSGVTALLNSTIIALGRAKQAGLDVPKRPFKVAATYYPLYYEKNGTFKYDQHNMFPHEPRNGRTITSIMALKVLGLDGNAKYKPLFAYARDNIDKTMTHHTPSLHMTLCAYVFRELGKKDWKNYVDTYVEKLIARQRKDGSLETIWDGGKLFMTPNDTSWGATYATTHFAIILQIPKGHVNLYVKD